MMSEGKEGRGKRGGGVLAAVVEVERDEIGAERVAGSRTRLRLDRLF